MMVVILRRKGGPKIFEEVEAGSDNSQTSRSANPVAPPPNRRYWNRHAFDFDQASLVVGLLTAAFRSACA
jgi:hypothetical protein